MPKDVPLLALDEVRFLTVTDVTPHGAFVDWGMPKELLVPFAEQTCSLVPGARHPIGLCRDRDDRPFGTMRIRELLLTGGRFERDELVEGEAWRAEPGLGVFCIIERKYLGLLSADEPHTLRRGEQTTFRVREVREDGKLFLSLRGKAHEELASDAQHVLDVLARSKVAVGDHSSPARIAELFGLSKKAFQRAVGRLLKEGAVSIDEHGQVVPRRRP
jgi:uncharacterized protein